MPQAPRSVKRRPRHDREGDNGRRWLPLVVDVAGSGRRRWLRTGEAESRFVRLELPAGAGGGIARIAFAPIELAVAPARYAAAVARAARRGRYPRHLLGEQAYWAVVGGDGDERKALLGEDGALEVAAECFSVEPFLWSDGRLHGWADAASAASLVDGCLPIPSVEWNVAGLRVRITAFAAGEPGRSALVAAGDGGVHVAVGGSLVRPPGGIVLVSPLARPLREVLVDGHAYPFADPEGVHLHDIPAEVLLRYG